jgi:hypothetical protein
MCQLPFFPNSIPFLHHLPLDNHMQKPDFKKWFKNEDLKKKVKQFADILSRLLSVPQRTNEANQPKAHDVTERYWSQASPIHDWLRSHGVEYSPEKIPKYSQGGAGRAYFLDDYVVKFSANKVEANVALMYSKSMHTPIIDVLPLDGGIYAILQHRVDMDGQDVKDAADYVTTIVDDHPDMEGFPTDAAIQTKFSQEALNNYGGNQRLLPYMLMVITALSQLYRATGFKHDDAGPKNVGMHHNKVVFPDLGPNETGDFDPDQAMNKIAQNRQSLNLPAWDII